jgi:Domain of unknown function (DUF4157)
MKKGMSAETTRKQAQKKPVHPACQMLGRSNTRSADAHERQADAVAERIFGVLTPCRRIAAAVSLNEGGIDSPSPRAGEPRAPARGRESTSTNSGAPLPSGLRNFFEDQFGHDLGLVRIHAGPRAAAAAALFSADGYTLGHDIAFAEGRYDPSSAEGMRLLAHELTHVVQQTSTAPPAGLTATAGPQVQCSQAGYQSAMNAKPEPAWQQAALHLNGESEATIQIILGRLSPLIRARLHRAALRWPGKNSNIGKMTLADYKKVFPEEAAAEAAADARAEQQAKAEPQAKAAAVPAVQVVAHGKRTRVEAAIELLRRAKALGLAGDHERAQAYLAKIWEFVNSITAEKNVDTRFAEATGYGRDRGRAFIREARSAIAGLRTWYTSGATPSAGSWQYGIERFAITKEYLEILTGERTYAGSPVAQATEEGLKTTAIIAGVVAASFIAVPVIIAGAPVIAQLGVNASAIATVLAVDYPTASLIAAEELLRAAIQIHETGSFSLDPYQMLNLIIHINGARYTGSGRVTSSGGGRATVQITKLEPADEGTRVGPPGQWISGYRAPVTPGNAAAEVRPAPSPAPLRSVPVLPKPAVPSSLPAPPLEEPVAAPPRPRSPAVVQRARAAVAGVAIGFNEATDLGRIAPRTEIPAAAAAAVASPPRTQWTTAEPGHRAGAAAARSVARPSGPQIAAPARRPSLEAAKEAVRTDGPTQANLFNLLNALPPNAFEELKLALGDVGMAQEILQLKVNETQAAQAQVIARDAVKVEWKETDVPRKLADRASRVLERAASTETARANQSRLDAASEAIRTGGYTRMNLFNLLNALPPRQFEELKLALEEVGMPQESLDLIDVDTQAAQAMTIATDALREWKEPGVPKKLVDRALRTFDTEAARETERAHRARVDAAKDALRKGGPTRENLFNLLKTLSPKEFEQLKEELHETGMPQEYLHLLTVPNQIGQSLTIAQHAVGDNWIAGKVPEKVAAKALAVGTPEGAAGAVRAEQKRQEMLNEAKEALRKGGPTWENLFNVMKHLTPREFSQLKASLRDIGMDEAYLPILQVPNQVGQALVIAHEAVRGGWIAGDVKTALMRLLLRSY